MKFDQNYQHKLLNDVVAQRFDEADDLCQFVQTRVGKPDGSVVTMNSPQIAKAGRRCNINIEGLIMQQNAARHRP